MKSGPKRLFKDDWRPPQHQDMDGVWVQRRVGQVERVVWPDGE